MHKLPIFDCEAVETTLLNFIRKEMTAAGFTKVVLGLSGGLDSAVSAALAVKALGKEHVTGLLMPWKTSSPASAADATLVADFLGIETHTIEITPMVEAFANQMMRDKGVEYDRRLGNVMARVRMIQLFDWSLAHNSLVLGTGNKSEIALGYSTLFGDSASAFDPIGDVYKSDLFLLARYMGLPEKVIAKAPSADLWEGQTDEDEIGFSYAEIDPVLHGLLEMQLSTTDLIGQGYDANIVNFASKRLAATQFKRKMPPIAQVSSHTF